MTQHKAVVLFSGGLDSTCLLSRKVAEGSEPLALSVNYGQRHVKELEAARAICNRLGVAYLVADLSAIRWVLGGSSQTDDTVPVPHGHYTDESMKKTVVPNRNLLMISVATSLAVSKDIPQVCFAAHAGDHPIYPDCRPDFFRSALGTLFAATDGKVALSAPFIDMTKGEALKSCAQFVPPLHLTWSCYEGGEVHCGECGTCVERKEAFAEAGVYDPTTYLK